MTRTFRLHRSRGTPRAGGGGRRLSEVGDVPLTNLTLNILYNRSYNRK